MRVGVLALQGGIVEHVHMLKRAAEKTGKKVEVVEVRKKEHLNQVEGIVLPGGESTSISRLGKRLGLTDPLRERITNGMPVLATCAGAALLAKEVIDKQSGKRYEPWLGVADVKVIRNYFGRQRESFEADLEVEGIGTFRGVFIRAPVMEPLSDNAKVLSSFDGRPVMIMEGNVILTSFHPELASDTRIHEMFLNLLG